MVYWGPARTGLNWFTRGSVDTPEPAPDFRTRAVRRTRPAPAKGCTSRLGATAFTGENTDRPPRCWLSPDRPGNIRTTSAKSLYRPVFH